MVDGVCQVKWSAQEMRVGTASLGSTRGMPMTCNPGGLASRCIRVAHKAQLHQRQEHRDAWQVGWRQRRHVARLAALARSCVHLCSHSTLYLHKVQTSREHM